MQNFYFQSQFLYVKNGPNISNFFLIEQYNFFVIEIFWHLQFLKHFFFLNDVQFLTTAMHVCKRPKIFFTIVCIGFEHKGWSCKVCESVRQKCGYTILSAWGHIRNQATCCKIVLKLICYTVHCVQKLFYTKLFLPISEKLHNHVS